MKIRTGFVSNSSSSSFCIYGAIIEPNEIEDKFLEDHMAEIIEDLRGNWYYKNHPDELPTNLESLKEYFEDEGGYSDLLYTYFSSVHFPEGYDGYYVGQSWRTIGDNETGLEFKQRVEAEIKAMFPNAKCDTYEEAYYS